MTTGLRDLLYTLVTKAYGGGDPEVVAVMNQRQVVV